MILYCYQIQNRHMYRYTPQWEQCDYVHEGVSTLQANVFIERQGKIREQTLQDFVSRHVLLCMADYYLRRYAGPLRKK